MQPNGHQIIIGFVMDPIQGIKPAKDTSLALMLAAQARNWDIVYFEPQDLWIEEGVAMGRGRRIKLHDDPERWFEWRGEPESVKLGSLDAILMRQDPPFDLEYITCTYTLERAAAEGALIVNRPQSLRDCNEKIFTAWFGDVSPPTLFSRSEDRLREFHRQHQDVIFKPVDGMGGSGIFRISGDGMNLGAVLEQLTDNGRRTIVAQRYLPAIKDGDKRILMINGEPVPYALARIPAAGETRGNLAAGGTGRPQPLSEADRRIAERVGPELKKRGLYFVGLDVIGEHLTEINVTSPTCAREIDRAYNTDIGGKLMDVIEQELSAQ